MLYQTCALAIIVATSAAPTPPVVDNKRKLGGTVDDGFMGFATAQHSQEALAQQWRENCPPCPTGGFCCPALGCKITETVKTGTDEGAYQAELWAETPFPWYEMPLVPVLSATHPVWTFLQINKQWWLYCFFNDGEAAPAAMPPTAAAATEPTAVAATKPPMAKVGADADEHGCRASAGFAWCAAKGKCLRSWEESCSSERGGSRRLDAAPADAAPALALQSPGAKGDPLTLDGGYLGGQVTVAPDKPGAPASWTQFAGLGLVTGGKYVAAGVETGLDWITGGAFQGSSNSVVNTANRFTALDSDTANDFATLSEGGTVG